MTDETSRLLGLTDRELIMICGEATHQHFKGGLYKYLGPVMDSDTGEQLTIGGDQQVLYQHVYPHKKQFWVRTEEDFFGLKDIGVAPEYKTVPRFRLLGTIVTHP